MDVQSRTWLSLPPEARDWYLKMFGAVRVVFGEACERELRFEGRFEKDGAKR